MAANIYRSCVLTGERPSWPSLQIMRPVNGTSHIHNESGIVAMANATAASLNPREYKDNAKVPMAPSKASQGDGSDRSHNITTGNV